MSDMNASTSKHLGYPPSKEKSKSGLKTFFGFLLVSCVLGLGVRVYFAPQRITPLLKEQMSLSLPQFKIGFKSAELILADGLLPALSLEMRDIEISSKKNCGAEIPPIRIQKAILPLSFFKLFERKLALSLVSVQKIEVDIENFQNGCSETAEASPAPPSTETKIVAPPSSGISIAKHVFWDDQKLAQIDQVLTGVEIDELKFYFDHHQKFLIFRNFNLRQDKAPGSFKSSYRLKSEFVLPSEYAQGDVLPTAFILAELTSEKMNFDVSTQISEGHVQLTSNVTPDVHSPMLDISIQAKQLPVSALTIYLSKLGLLSATAQPKFVWLSFSAAMKGRLDQLKQLPIEVKDVLLDGEFGQATISHVTRNSDGVFSDFILELPKVQVQKALELFGVKGPDGIFSQFGDLSGQLLFKTAKNFEFKGQWQDASLKFSRRGARSEQQIENLKFDLTYLDNRWRGKISDVELENGAFEGEIQLNFDPTFSEGEIEIASEKLEFNPSVQKNMFLGTVSGIKLNGKMNVNKFIIQSWDGELQVASLESDELSFKRAKLLSHFGGNRLSINAKIAEAEYKYNSEMRKIGKQVFLNFEDKSQNLVLTNLKAEISQASGQWTWKAMKSSLLEDRIQFSSSGDVNSSDLLTGELNLDFPKAKKLVWQFQGSWDHLSLNPVSTNLKNLLSKKADYKTLGLSTRE